MELLTQRLEGGRVTERGELGLLFHVNGHAHERTGHVGGCDRVGHEGRGGVLVESGRPRPAPRSCERGQGQSRVRAIAAVDLAGREVRAVEEHLLAEHAVGRRQGGRLRGG